MRTRGGGGPKSRKFCGRPLCMVPKLLVGYQILYPAWNASQQIKIGCNWSCLDGNVETLIIEAMCVEREGSSWCTNCKWPDTRSSEWKESAAMSLTHTVNGGLKKSRILTLSDTSTLHKFDCNWGSKQYSTSLTTMQKSFPVLRQSPSPLSLATFGDWNEGRQV